jgi:hypothetical protein
VIGQRETEHPSQRLHRDGERRAVAFLDAAESAGAVDAGHEPREPHGGDHPECGREEDQQQRQRGPD